MQKVGLTKPKQLQWWEHKRLRAGHLLASKGSRINAGKKALPLLNEHADCLISILLKSRINGIFAICTTVEFECRPWFYGVRCTGH